MTDATIKSIHYYLSKSFMVFIQPLKTAGYISPIFFFRLSLATYLIWNKIFSVSDVNPLAFVGVVRQY